MKAYKTVRIQCAALVAALLLFTSCRYGQTIDSAEAKDAVIDAPSQLMPATKIERLKKALPRFGWDRINEILADRGTLFYDHDTITPSYQDSIGAPAEGDHAVMGARPNAIGDASIAEGITPRPFKTDRWVFPFGKTAGTDASDNIEIANFLSLPTESGRRLPIAHWIEKAQSVAGFTLNLVSWRWVYPVGTVIGEMIFIKNGDDIYLSELRTRQRFASGWAANVYRPFPTAATLAAAIKAKRPAWETDTRLKAVMARLEGNAALTPATLSSAPFPRDVFTQAGFRDDLPDFGDDALVKDLLRSTTFVSAYGSVWRADGADKAFAPTTTAAFSIVPRAYDAGLIEVNDESCARCHRETQRPLAGMMQPVFPYGEVWGSDQIFSFHPFDESTFKDPLVGIGVDNRRANAAFTQAGLIEVYDAAKHPAARYAPLKVKD